MIRLFLKRCLTAPLLLVTIGNMVLRIACFAALIYCLLGMAPLCAAPPVISHLRPTAATPGQTDEITLHGSNLAGPSSLWTSFSARYEFLPAESESAKKGEQLTCRVTVARDQQIGIGAICVITAAGASNPMLIMLDDLATLPEASDNHDFENAQHLGVPFSVDGNCDKVQEDFFRFRARSGQPLSFDIVAARLGSKLDPVVRLLDAQNSELLSVDDTFGTGGDSRFLHTFTADGKYTLAIRDVRHGGGSDYHYRLRVGRFPLVTTAYPAGGKAGSVTSFEVIGAATAKLGTQQLELPKAARPGLISLGVNSPGDDASGWFLAEVEQLPECLEQEPNEEESQATPVDVPCVINGRLVESGDRDHFKFHAGQGQQVYCVAKTRELGSPCDLYMSLHKADGTRLAEASQQRETILDHTVPEEGDYILRIESLVRGGGPEHVYRVAVRSNPAGFSLHPKQKEYTVPHGGTLAVGIDVKRAGYDGPIDLTVEGLGDGLTLEGNKLEGGEGELKITLPTDLSSGERHMATIVGRAADKEHAIAVAADYRDLLAGAFPNAIGLPESLRKSTAVTIGPPFPPFFELAVAGNRAHFPQLVGAAGFAVDVARLNEEFKETINLSVEGLPAEITADIQPVEDGQKQYHVALAGPPDLELSTIPLRIIGTATFKHQKKTVTLEDVQLRITKPLVVSVELAGPVVVGGTLTATLRVVRFGESPAPVEVRFREGPAGLSAPIVTTIPSDTDQIDVVLAAGPNTVPGNYDSLIAVASTMVSEENIVVDSGPVAVEVQPAPEQ